jgi:hypothetical protein
MKKLFPAFLLAALLIGGAGVWLASPSAAAAPCCAETALATCNPIGVQRVQELQVLRSLC